MHNISDENSQDLAALKQAAEAVVSQALGRGVQFATMNCLTEPDRRNALYRCFVADEPETLIVKQVLPRMGADERDSEWEQKRFFNDWVGAEFLSALPADAPISPHFYGGDPQFLRGAQTAGFFVLEDLGEPRSLVEPLLHGDAAAAESALMRYSSSLGKMHALTAGKAAAFEALYAQRLSGAVPYAYERQGLGARFEQIPQLLEAWGVPSGGALLGEIQAVMAAVTQPGPFLTYIHSDPCPDNVFDRDDGLRLIDFESSHFGHALLDALYPRMLFPSCWCANRLPGALVSRLEKHYRAELSRGCPQAQEDSLWETALVQVCALFTLNTLAFELEDTLKEDHEWGISTMRPRILARLEAFIDTAAAFGRLPALRGAASQLLPQLQARWADVPALPLYPAFRPAV